MSLDFVLFSKDRALEHMVELSEETHGELVIAAEALDLTAILVFDDYYSDAQMPPEDLPKLEKQIAILQAGGKLPTDVGKFLTQLSLLVRHAIAGKKILYAIAD